MFQKVGAFFSRVAAPIKKHAVVLVSFGVAAIQTAHAALPTSATTAITDVAADGQSMFDLVFPVVATFVGLGLTIKLFKRFTRSV